MNLSKIANALDILTYPEALNDIDNFESIPDIKDINWLTETENRYHILGKYFPLVCQAAAELKNDLARYQWGMTVAKYLSYCPVPEARNIPMPARNGTLASDFLPLLILLTTLPYCISESRRRKMPEDMIRRNLDHIVDGISIVEKRTGTPAIDLTYFRWLVKFFKVTLFNCHGFNFEVRELPSNVFVLQSKADNTLIPTLHNTTIHRSGNILNSAGCLDSEGNYSVQFIENKDHYIATPCINGYVSNVVQTYSKEQYTCVLKPGDIILSVHIPRGTDISAHSATTSLLAGFRDAKLYFPESEIKALYCHSWLLDPKLKLLMNPDANIPQFGELFTRFPARSAGAEIFSFVFPRKMPLNELPENTSLERILKKHYINGNFILAYSGITLPEML